MKHQHNKACMAMCLSKVTGYDLQEIPDFWAEHQEDGEGFYAGIREWLKSQGYSLCLIMLPVETMREALHSMSRCGPKPYIMAVMLGDIGQHAIVCQEEVVIYDPVDSGVIDPTVDDYKPAKKLDGTTSFGIFVIL